MCRELLTETCLTIPTFDNSHVTLAHAMIWESKKEKKNVNNFLFSGVFWSSYSIAVCECCPSRSQYKYIQLLCSRYILLGGEIAQPNLCPNLPSRINIFLFMISNFYLSRQYRRNDKIQLPLLFLTFRSRLSIYWILSLISCHREFVVMITSLGQCTGIHV